MMSFRNALTPKRDRVKLYQGVVLMLPRKRLWIVVVALAVLLGSVSRSMAQRSMAQPNSQMNEFLGVPLDSLPGCIDACDSGDCLHQCVNTYSTKDGIAKVTTTYVDPIQSARTVAACFDQALDHEQVCQDLFLSGDPAQRDPRGFGICAKGAALLLLSCDGVFDQSETAAPVPVETSQLAMVELMMFFDVVGYSYPPSLSFNADPTQQPQAISGVPLTPFMACAVDLKERGEFCQDFFQNNAALRKFCLAGANAGFTTCLRKAGIIGPEKPKPTPG